MPSADVVPGQAGDPDRERRAARRGAAKKFHPDRGGSADAFIAALAATEDAPSGAAIVAVHTTAAGRVRRTRHRMRRAARTVRTRLPRSLPGSLRYHNL
ncbi:MAG: hypothetical protein ABI251_05615 [Mycobacteriaceae bacterium]